MTSSGELRSGSEAAKKSITSSIKSTIEDVVDGVKCRSICQLVWYNIYLYMFGREDFH